MEADDPEGRGEAVAVEEGLLRFEGAQIDCSDMVWGWLIGGKGKGLSLRCYKYLVRGIECGYNLVEVMLWDDKKFDGCPTIWSTLYMYNKTIDFHSIQTKFWLVPNSDFLQSNSIQTADGSYTCRLSQRGCSKSLSEPDYTE